MFIFNLFRLKKQPQVKNIIADTTSPMNVTETSLPPTQLREDLEKTKRTELTKIWKSNGSQDYMMPKGTRLWHGGTISGNSELDDSHSLWCTCDFDKAGNYDNSARENSKHVNLAPYRLTFETSRELKLANFRGASLLRFTHDHCECQHNIMKIALRNWCVAHNFDGVVNINRGSDEVVVCNPRSDLEIVDALPL